MKEYEGCGAIPLSAEIEVDTKGVSKVTVSIKDIFEGAAPFVREYDLRDLQGIVNIPVYGLFPGIENTVVFSAFDSDGILGDEIEAKIVTNALPMDFPAVSSTGFIDSGWTMVNWLRTPRSRPEMNAIAVDEAGRIRWYTDFFHPVIFPVVIKDGSIFCGDGAAILYQYDFMGYEINRIDVSQFGYTEIHHDIFIKDDGNFLIGVSKIDDPWIEDRIIEINPAENTLVNEWDLKDIFPDVCDLYNDIPLTDPDEEKGTTNDPVHNNSIFYDSSDNTLIVGSQRSGIAKITYDNEIVWFFAPHITNFIDDSNKDGYSDSLVDGYSSSNLLSAAGDFKRSGYVDSRFPMGAIEDRAKYPEDFSYSKYLLTPVDFSGNAITNENILKGFENHNSFVWPARAHSSILLKNGNLMMFDNGLARNFSFPPISQTHYSRAAEFEIIEDVDGKGGTVRQVWEHVINESPLWYGMSPLVSNVSELDNGNILIASGAIGTSVMTDLLRTLYGNGPVGAIIMEVDPFTGNEKNRLVFSRYIDDNYPINEFSIYRAYRFDMNSKVK
ncbi:MAG TPA: aryl-sulfate sulfotransferase [bacterium]|nr:aryl-sulfate sulfotransferase [bacterium]